MRHKPPSHSAQPQRERAASRPSTSRPSTNKGPDIERDSERYVAFKDAIMSDIVTSRAFEEKAMKRLFRDWTNANPAAYQPVLQRCIADISADLEISP